MDLEPIDEEAQAGDVKDDRHDLRIAVDVELVFTKSGKQHQQAQKRHHQCRHSGRHVRRQVDFELKDLQTGLWRFRKVQN